MPDLRFGGPITEVRNRNLLVNELLDAGFNAYLPVYDRGVDLIAYRDADAQTVPIQLKGRWMIAQKYVGLDVWIAFPDNGEWYLAPHERMIEIAKERGFTSTLSWIDGGAYSCPSMGKALQALMADFKLSSFGHAVRSA